MYRIYIVTDVLPLFILFPLPSPMKPRPLQTSSAERPCPSGIRYSGLFRPIGSSTENLPDRLVERIPRRRVSAERKVLVGFVSVGVSSPVRHNLSLMFLKYKKYHDVCFCCCANSFCLKPLQDFSIVVFLDSGLLFL